MLRRAVEDRSRSFQEQLIKIGAQIIGNKTLTKTVIKGKRVRNPQGKTKFRIYNKGNGEYGGSYQKSRRRRTTGKSEDLLQTNVGIADRKKGSKKKVKGLETHLG